MAECYVRSGQQFQPINIISTGQIKCSVCNKLFPLDKIDSHLSSHLHPKHLISKTSEIKVQKMSVPKSLFTNLQDQDTDIAIRSMMAEELPQSQIERKKVKVSKPEESISSTVMPLSNFIVGEDKCDLVSKVGPLGIDSEQVSLLNIEKEIELPQKAVTIQKRNLHLYQNLKENKQSYNEVQIVKRNPKKPQQVREAVYEVYSESPKKPEKQRMDINKVKIPVNYSKSPAEITLISTNTGSNWRYSKNLPDQAKTDDGKDPLGNSFMANTRMKGDLGCPCCGGFYCSVCKSDIPPQFRPVPGQDSQISTGTNGKDVRAFWAHFHRMESRGKCEHCDE